MIELGNTYRDKITGFIGVCTGHCTYISGCDQALLQPLVDDKGKREEGCWFDIQRLVATSADRIVLDNSKTPGADSPAPIR